MIKYIIHIQESTGQIVSVSYPQAETPIEGVSGDMRVVYLSEDNLPKNFKEPKFFITNFWWKDNQFVEVGEKPNQYASWDTSSNNWVWESSLLFGDVRKVRNLKLRQSDWTRMDDNGLDDDDRELWAIYRQELRDITEVLDGIESLDDVIWPTKPE